MIRAIYKSAERQRPVRLEPFEKRRRPSLKQEIRKPPVEKPREIKAQSPAS